MKSGNTLMLGRARHVRDRVVRGGRDARARHDDALGEVSRGGDLSTPALHGGDWVGFGRSLGPAKRRALSTPKARARARRRGGSSSKQGSAVSAGNLDRLRLLSGSALWRSFGEALRLSFATSVRCKGKEERMTTRGMWAVYR